MPESRATSCCNSLVCRRGRLYLTCYLLPGSNVMDGNSRDVLKFYHKRLGCQCLKQKYSLARQVLPKMGRCSGCKKPFERRRLLTCSACKSNGSLYCSPKCQRADYHNHKDDCEETIINMGMEPGFYREMIATRSNGSATIEYF